MRGSLQTFLVMHDLTYFRNNLDAVAARLADRGFTLDLDEFRALDAQRRSAMTEAEQLKSEKNKASEEIGKLKRQGADTTEAQAKSRAAGERIAELDKKSAE